MNWPGGRLKRPERMWRLIGLESVACLCAEEHPLLETRWKQTLTRNCESRYGGTTSQRVFNCYADAHELHLQFVLATKLVAPSTFIQNS